MINFVDLLQNNSNHTNSHEILIIALLNHQIFNQIFI